MSVSLLSELECLPLKEALLSESECLATDLVLLLPELECLPEVLVDLLSEFECFTREEFLVLVLERFSSLLSELHLVSEAVLSPTLGFLFTSLLEEECLHDNDDDDDDLVSEDACFLGKEKCLLELDELLFERLFSDEVLLDTEPFLLLTFSSSVFELCEL